MTLLDLYHRHVGAAFDRQQRLAEYLDAHGDGGAWGYTVSTAALTFGKAVAFQADLLGSYADDEATWLWAWANRSLQLPATSRAVAEAVRRLDGPAGFFDEDDAVAVTAEFDEQNRLVRVDATIQPGQ